MCNMAAYVGEHDAAPILMDMLRREEGFEGGFGSGIATLHEGKIHYAKLVGATDRLEALTEAAKLPGKIGIIHSRSGCREGDEWAHPFIAERDGVIRTAYVANGAQGFFSPIRPKLAERGNELAALGYNMRTRQMLTDTPYHPVLSDGMSVHMSDVMCQLIQYNLDRGHTAVSAMDAAFRELPAELAGLLLTLSEPDAVVWSRINMPLFIGFAEHGAYMATTALAFPADAGKAQLIPGSTAGRTFRDHYEVVPYREDVCNVGRITPEIAHDAYEIVCSLLREGGRTYSSLYGEIKSCFPPSDCIDSEPLTYSILQTLAAKGVLKIETELRPGHKDGVDAPKCLLTLCDGK